MSAGRQPPSFGSSPAAALLVRLAVVGSIAGAGLTTASVAGALPTPPPTPVGGALSPFPTVLHTPRPSVRPPTIDSAEAVLEDLDTGQVLFARRPNTRRPIASITKVMTALLVLERSRLSTVVTVGPEAASANTGSVLGLEAGERISVRNLLYALLLQSSNDAAIALAESVGGTVDEFVALMNRRARELRLRHTRFSSPHGLDNQGYSTPADLARLTRAAGRLSGFDGIVRTKDWTIPAPSGPERRIQNRNFLLWLYRGATGVKTGFTTPSGHCLVATAERDGRRLVAVVLGDPEEPFDDGAALLNYGFEAFARVTVVGRGRSLGTLRVGGSPVDVVSGGTLVRLVRRDERASIERRLVAGPGLRLPIAPGERVGKVVVTVSGRKLGQVPAVSEGAAPSPRLSPGQRFGTSPWRELIAVLGLMVRAVLGAFL